MDVVVSKVLSKRLGGAIFTAQDAASVRDASRRKSFRIKADAGRLDGAPLEGETWRLEGSFVNDADYGRQFLAASGCRLRPEGRLICRYLSEQVDGIGDERAERLWETFGAGLDDIMREGDLVVIGAALTPSRPNLGLQLAAATVAAWNALSSELDLASWLVDHGVADLRTMTTIHAILGQEAVARLTANPYSLVALLPWRTVDAIGHRVLGAGASSSPMLVRERVVGAADAVVAAFVRRGHTAMGHNDFAEAISVFLGLHDQGDTRASVAIAIDSKAVLPEGLVFRAPGCALMENVVCQRLARLKGSGTTATVKRQASASEIASLHAEQVEAVEKILALPLSCLQGAAGTGKTHVLRTVCEAWERGGGDVILCALSGKATMKMVEATGRPAMTIRRTLLGLEGDQDKRSGLKIGSCSLIVIDEASMIDLESAYRLLERMPDGARLLLVGDERQLPPVGFGLLYHKLVRDPSIVARLETVHRHAATNSISRVAAAIRRRELPDMETFGIQSEGASIHVVRTRGSAADMIVQIASAFEAHPMIVTPTNLGRAGTHDLNSLFHDLHRDGKAEVHGSDGNRFSTGDPVVHLHNDYERGLFNGSIGTVTDVDETGRSVTVEFDGTLHVFARATLSDIGLAYATTCHRAQGSQARRVIVAVYSCALLDPSWLYTAITRAVEQLVIVAEEGAMAEAIGRPWASERRQVGMTWPPLTQKRLRIDDGKK